MNWKVNSKKTTYDLKNNDLKICIHRLHGLDGWFLSCYRLNIKDMDLNTEDFNEAVKNSQVIIMEIATEIHELATDFTKNAYDNNEISRY